MLVLAMQFSRNEGRPVLAVAAGHHKKAMFTLSERIEMAREVVAPYPEVEVESFSGLLRDFVVARGGKAMVRGLRAVTDFDYELQMAQMNYGLTEVETLFVATNPLYSFLSSSLIKEVATYGGDVSGLVPETVLRRLTERLAQGFSGVWHDMNEPVSFAAFGDPTLPRSARTRSPTPLRSAFSRAARTATGSMSTASTRAAPWSAAAIASTTTISATPPTNAAGT